MTDENALTPLEAWSVIYFLVGIAVGLACVLTYWATTYRKNPSARGIGQDAFVAALLGTMWPITLTWCLLGWLNDKLVTPMEERGQLD